MILTNQKKGGCNPTVARYSQKQDSHNSALAAHPGIPV